MKRPTNAQQPRQPITNEQAEEMASYGEAIAEGIKVAERVRRADAAMQRRQLFTLFKADPI